MIRTLYGHAQSRHLRRMLLPSVPVSHLSLTRAPPRMYLFPFLITAGGHRVLSITLPSRKASPDLAERTAGFRHNEDGRVRQSGMTEGEIECAYS